MSAGEKHFGGGITGFLRSRREILLGLDFGCSYKHNTMPSMTWLLIAYLLVLGFLSFHKGGSQSAEGLKGAWRWFAFVPLSHALFTLFRVANHNDRDIVLVEIWANGFAWLFMGISILKLSGAILGSEKNS